MNERFPPNNPYGHPYNPNHLPVATNGGQHQVAVYNPYTQPEFVDDDIDLRRLWRIISKYRWTVFAVFAVAVITTLVACLLVRPVYRASTLVEAQPNQRIVKFENVQQADLNDREYLNTQINILRSESVAKAVITNADLAGDPEFNGELKQRGLIAGIGAVKESVTSAFSAVAASLSGSDPSSDVSGNNDGLPAEVIFEREMMNRYQESLTISEIPNSDLLRVSFDSFSPQKAAQLANAHTQAYIQSSEQRRFNSTSSAKEFLQRQIQQAQADLESSEKALTDFARDNNIVDVEDRSNSMETRLEDLNKALTTTRQSRINAQVEYMQAQEGELDSLPAVLEGELIRNLREQHAELRSEYQEMSRIFKDSYPKMQQLKSKMDDIKATLKEESQNLVAGLSNRYEQLQSQEEELSRQVETQQSKLLDLKDRAISYNILKREWEANKELYSGLLEKQKDVSVAAGMEISNISVVDQAAIPAVKFTPKTTRNVAIAGVFGLMGGVGFAFLLAFMDNTFRTREDLEETLKLTFLGMVPKASAGRSGPKVPIPLICLHEPTDPISEAIRSIRTSILFSRPDNVPKKLLITSTTSEEGKSTIAANLASVMAQNGARVLIMETDLRRPNVSAWMEVERTPGLSEYLGGQAGEIVKATPYENLYCVPAGSHVPNPAELLGSTRMDDYLKTLSENFDFIIVDGPPILGLADSMVLSSKVDGVLLVVKAASTEKEAVEETVKRLRTINAPIIGSILNYVDFSQREYGYYQSYYYGYGQDRRERGDNRKSARDSEERPASSNA